MALESRRQSDSADDILDVVLQGLDQPAPPDLNRILRAIARAVDAYGAILWELAPGATDHGSDDHRPLFTVGYWLDDDRLPIHALPLRSVTGEAVMGRRTINVPDISSDHRIFPNAFLTSATIRTMCAVPVTFHGGTKGSLNVYRTDPRPFTPSEVTRVERIALVIPSLFQGIRDRLSIELLSCISERIRRDTTEDSSFKDVRRWPVLDDVVKLVSTTLRCRETSIFLEDPLEKPGRFVLAATSYPDWCPIHHYESDDASPTGRVLASGDRLKIFDLFEAARDPDTVTAPKAGMVHDTRLTPAIVQEALGLPDNSEVPPVSFMAAPVRQADRVIGVIRCTLGMAAPYRFAGRELDLLDVVAGEVGHYWTSWLARRDMEYENRSWRDLVQAISNLNVLVNKELAKPAPDEARIFAEALEATGVVVRGAEIIDVRLLDEAHQELYFAYTRGSAWNEGSTTDIAQRKQRRFPVRPGSRPSAGAHVFQTGQLHVVRDPSSDPYYDGTFTNVHRMIVAPISVEEKCFGVLDLRARGESDLPAYAETIAQLLGKQLGLYHYLVATIARMRKAEATNIETTNQHAQSFQDLGHQLKSPIIQAYARAEVALKIHAAEDRLRPHLKALRGLSGKAVRVVKNTTLFADLARGKRITPIQKRLGFDELVKLLIEAAMDHELILAPSRHVHFHVERETFDVVNRVDVAVDVDLLEQAINAVLDNAAKYSFDNSQVRIFGGLTGTGRFHITVVDRGLPIRSEDVGRCPERGWRSEEAGWTTGEGSGIGLWIVDNILKAHEGDLVIVPTVRNQTEVKLVFPVRQG